MLLEFFGEEFCEIPFTDELRKICILTNHFINHKIKKEIRVEATYSSCTRYKRASFLLSQYDNRNDFAFAKSLLRDTENDKFSILVPYKIIGDSYFGTLANIFLDSRNLCMTVVKVLPNQTPLFKNYSLKQNNL